MLQLLQLTDKNCWQMLRWCPGVHSRNLSISQTGNLGHRKNKHEASGHANVLQQALALDFAKEMEEEGRM